MVIWTRKNQIPQTFSDEQSSSVIHKNITFSSVRFIFQRWGHHLGFASLRWLLAAILGHIFNNWPYKENDINAGKTLYSRQANASCYVERLFWQFDHLLIFFYRMLNFFSFRLLMKRLKKAKFKGKYRPKVHHLRFQTTLHLKSNVSPIEIYYKILGQLEL